MKSSATLSSATVTSYRDLRIWQLGVGLAQEVYLMTANFPRREVYGLSAQLRKSAVSIPSNIAEGHTRESTREFLHFLSMAQASLSELETQLEIAGRLKYLAPSKLENVYAKTSSLGKQLYALRNTLVQRS